MLIVLGLLGGYLLWIGRRGVIANNNLTFSIESFRVHKVTIANIECVVNLSIINASNQDYTIGKAFFIVKYPKGGLSSGNIGNTLTSFESLQDLQIKARQNIRAEAKANPQPRIDVFSKEKIKSILLKNIQNRQKNIPKTQKINIQEDKIKQTVNELYNQLDKAIDKLLKN